MSLKSLYKILKVTAIQYKLGNPSTNYPHQYFKSNVQCLALNYLALNYPYIR